MKEKMSDLNANFESIQRQAGYAREVIAELYNLRSALLYHGMDQWVQPGQVGKWLDVILMENGLTEEDWSVIRDSSKWNGSPNPVVKDDDLYRLKDALGIGQVACDFETVIDVAKNIRQQYDVLTEEKNAKVTEVKDEPTRVIRRIFTREQTEVINRQVAGVMADHEAEWHTNARDVINSMQNVINNLLRRVVVLERNTLYSDNGLLTTDQLQKVHEVAQEEIQRHFEHNPPAGHTHTPGPTAEPTGV